MSKPKKYQLSELLSVLRERYGELSEEQGTELMSALVMSIDADPNVQELTSEQYQLGVQIIEVAAAGRAESFQQAREKLAENPSILSEIEAEQSSPTQSDGSIPGGELGADLPAAISEQGGKLYKKVPDTFARQNELFGTALDQAVLADLNERIRTGDLEADIQEAMGKRQAEGRERAPTFIEMLGLPAVPSVPRLPESSAE